MCFAPTRINDARFEVLTKTLLGFHVFWDATLRRWVRGSEVPDVSNDRGAGRVGSTY